MKQALAALEAGWNHTAASLTPLGDGHIHDTMLATLADGEALVLQRINRIVFTEPGRVMDNLARVQSHLRYRASELTPRLHTTLNGSPAWIDPEGNWWRLWDYVADARSLNTTGDPALCRAAAEAFGRLQHLLADLPGPELHPTIPGFLQLTTYLAELDRVCEKDPTAADFILTAAGGRHFIAAHRHLAERFPPGQQLIHGDCKLNNLLFAPDDPSVRAILDLDTIMVGHWAWDFGDLVRSTLSGSIEDHQAPELFRALAEGFLQGSRRTDIIPEDLADAPVYISFMLGIRFLTDHLEGDRYFKVRARGENLSRAGAQFQLVRRLPALNLTAVAAEVLASAGSG